MSRASWLVVASLLTVSLIGCDGGADSDTDVVAAPTGPSMSWTDQPSESLVEGEPLTLTVSATDDDGVARVVAYFRTAGERTWNTAPPMSEADGAWTVELAGENVVAPGIEVYFKGEDALGQTSFEPENGIREPFAVDVRRVGVTLPYAQDFEDVPNDLLREIGWSETSLAFEGYAWGRTVGRAFSGDASLVHRRTPSTVNNDIEDWLISPPLDLTSLPQVQVSWMEFGDQSELSDHSLYISTGSPDPRDGDFELVQALSAPPEGEWGRSDTVDLSAYDVPAAYLAWVYKGRQADVWWVDDVSVRALAPDLRVTEVSWTPDPLSPGDSGTLTLSIDNRTTIDASAVEVVVDGGADVTFGSIAPVASIAGDATVQVQVPIEIDVDAVDNSWVDLDISLSTELDTWTHEDRLLIGEPSTLNLQYTLEPLDEADTAQLVRINMGVGDPEAPVFEVPLSSELLSSGTYDLELDITEYAEWLPPTPGVSRWWVRFENGPQGTLDVFEISWGGESYASTDLGLFVGFAPDVYFLPRPPDPQVSRQSSSPNPIAPGDSVAWTLDLVNRGDSTSGDTTVTLSTTDPAITLTDAGPKVLSGPEGWATGALSSTLFAFDVDETRKSSLPVRFIATVQDDFETFEVPVDVRVPWPVVTVTGVVIDDFSDGDSDGLLEPDESATLEVALTNVGGLATFGSTTCTMAQIGGAATVSIETSSSFAGILSAGSSTDEGFDVTVTSGAIGDDVQLEVTCTDREETYVSTLEIVLGERPWVQIAAVDDATGDARSDYTFDFVNGRYRSDGTTLQVQLRSATPHGGLTGLFVEAWANSPGGEYIYYNFVAAGTSGSMRGFAGGFTSLGSFVVSEVDSNTIQLDIPLEPLGLRLDAMSIGFGAGFCGGVDQYCDQFPNGWGAPYTGLFTSRWVTIRW